MKKFTSLLIGLSLTLAGAAMAQQPDEQSTPGPKHAAEKGKGAAGEAKSEAKETKHQNAAAEGHGAKNAPDAMQKAESTPKAAAASAAAQPEPKHGAKEQAQHNKGDVKANSETAKSSAAPAPSAAPSAVEKTSAASAATPAAKAAASATPATTSTAAATASPVTSAAASATPAATTAASATPAAATSSSAAPIATPKPNTAAATKKPDVQKVQQIRTEHANFTASAQPNLQIAPAVTFNQNYRVEGSDRWQGPQYEVYRSYRPERHDEGYYRSHYGQVELIGGGYYYQNNNYWYPAWGYNSRNEYYAYDGPIYAGHRGERVDRVIANVQASLKEMGYYTGAVDGLLGPLTRKALIGYQGDAGLTATATIDEPTLDSLNMSS